MRSLNGTEVTHQLGSGLGDIGTFAKSLCIGQSMIRRVGFGQSRELVGMGIPVKIAAIYDTASTVEAWPSIYLVVECVTMSQPNSKDGSCKGGKSIVDHQWHTV